MRNIFFILLFLNLGLNAQTKIISLEQAVELANKESLASFKAKNIYLADYWEFRTFKSNRLPSLTLNLTPLRYNRDFIRRYDSQNDVDVYRKQQTLYSHGNLALEQNFDWLGGTFFVDSELGYLRSFGDREITQFSSIPIRIGYRQQLIGYNPFKWEKKIAPIKYTVAQKELLYNIEQTAEDATNYFFNVVMAQSEYDLASERIKNTENLYNMGKERFKIASIQQSDLMTLRLDKINAENGLQTAEINLKRAKFALVSYLNMDKETDIKLNLPELPQTIEIDSKEAIKYARNNHPEFLKSKQKILELQEKVDKAKKEAQFNMGIFASVGFNQVAETFGKAYKSPLQQDVFSLTLSIPILDWGVRKGRYNIAKNNLSVAELSTQQEEIKLEEDILMTVGDFKIQQQVIYSTKEAVELANKAYKQTRERFIIGKADINSLMLSNERYQQAQRNYISALKNYWISYFKIRKLTLFDFEKNTPILITFDSLHD